jgi:hypothetical protein
VSSISYGDPPQPPLFFIVLKDSISVTDRNIIGIIEARLTEIGYQKATSFEGANVGVLFSYSIDPNGSIYSEPDYAVGGHNTYTAFPRHFQLAVIDLKKSKVPDKVELLWQGEIYSAGRSRNIGLVAPYFIEVLFENYGKTVSNQTFIKPMMGP